MTDETPRKKRARNPYLECANSILVQFTLPPAPLDETRERRGRPDRSPSLPPLDEPKTTDNESAK